MMDFLIDGTNAYTAYGVYLERNGGNGLMSFPSLKEPEKNDWHEYDGLEVDLSQPKLNTREFQMNLACVGNGYASMIAQLKGSKAYHTFTVFGRSFKLRLTQQPSMAVSDDLSKLSLKLADDFPLDLSDEGTVYVEPNGSVDVPTGETYTLDERDLEDYGVSVLSGTQAELLKAPAVKQNLLVNIPSQTGALYDDSTVRYQARDVRLSCLMQADNMAQMWRNYDALLYDLIRPEARSLNGHDCYYKSMSVSEFLPDARPWMKFALTLCFI